MIGFIDMTLEDENHHPVIFDFKWTSSKSYYRDLLSANRSIQLELYRQSVIATYPDKSVAGVGYYMMPKKQLITTDFDEIADMSLIKHIDKPAVTVTLGKRIQHSYDFRIKEIQKGHIEEAETMDIYKVEDCYYTHQEDANKEMCPYSFLSNNISELSKEIIENTRKVNKNKEILQTIREKYIKKIYEIINIILKNENIDFLCSFYGSSISGLSIENSDIDIMVKLKQNKTEYNYINRIMQDVFNNLKKNNINYLTNIMPIYTASVPVIKLECDLSNDEYFSHEINNIIKSCDLSYNDITKLYFDVTFFEVENENNKIPSELMVEYIKESIILYPQIIDIIYIMKRFLFNKKLNKSYKGGISSYSLFLLTLAFIKNFKDYYNIPIGSFLIEYLYYYSNFDFYNYIIQPNNEKEIYLKTEKNLIYKYNLNIIDPITGINVAKNTFKIDEIKNAFKEGLNIIIGNLYKVNGIDDNYNESKNDKKILEIFLTK